MVLDQLEPGQLSAHTHTHTHAHTNTHTGQPPATINTNRLSATTSHLVRRLCPVLMKAARVLSHAQWDAATPDEYTASSKKKKRNKVKNHLRLTPLSSLLYNRAGTREGRVCTAAKESFLQIKDERWQRGVQYVHVLHCHSNAVPAEESHTRCHGALSCV